MPASPLVRRTLAISSVALLAWSGSVVAASAAPDAGRGSTAAHGSAAPGQTKDKGPKAKGPKADPAKPKPAKGKPAKPKPGKAKPAKAKPTKANPAKTNPGKGNGPKNNPGKAGAGTGAGGVKDPAGNNGTIKIAPLGERDGTPDNNPHVTCGFQIEWYGFDKGSYYSQVSFAMQAPTKNATIDPHGPLSVFVGGDAASGAGTATGLDARESYYPTFTGTPHPKQGFHVKVTVATPFSQGNDTKSKVFWVQPCAVVAPGGTTPGGSTPGVSTLPPTSTSTSVSPPRAGVTGGQPTTDTPVTAVASRVNGSGVPSAVDAGEGGSWVLDRVRSPLPLLVAGVLLAAAAVVSRRRRSAAI